MINLEDVHLALAKKQKQEIVNILNGDVELRSKRELIEKFIEENLPHVDEDDISQAFETFWTSEKEKAFVAICNQENINPLQMNLLVNNYL